MCRPITRCCISYAQPSPLCVPRLLDNQSVESWSLSRIDKARLTRITPKARARQNRVHSTVDEQQLACNLKTIYWAPACGLPKAVDVITESLYQHITHTSNQSSTGNRVTCKTHLGRSQHAIDAAMLLLLGVAKSGWWRFLHNSESTKMSMQYANITIHHYTM